MAVKFKDDDDASSKEHKERVQAQERHVLCEGFTVSRTQSFPSHDSSLLIPAFPAIPKGTDTQSAQYLRGFNYRLWILQEDEQLGLGEARAPRSRVSGSCVESSPPSSHGPVRMLLKYQ